MSPHTKRIICCISPIVGIFFGYALAQVLNLMRLFGTKTNLDLSVLGLADSLLGAVFSLLGWALVVVIAQNSKLHCGGTQKLGDGHEERRRILSCVILPCIFLLIIAAFSLGSGSLLLYFITIIPVGLILIGEVVEGNPFKYLPILNKIIKS